MSKKIKIEVDGNFNDWELKKFSPNEISQILDIGKRLFIHNRDFLTEKIRGDLCETIKSEEDKKKEQHIQKLEVENEVLTRKGVEVDDLLSKMNKMYQDQMEKYTYIIDETKGIVNLKDNIKKGNIGEEWVMNILKDTFLGYEIVDTSAKGRSGDMILKSLNDDGDILVEVKNVRTITKSDVEKFYRDINECNTSCGIFINVQNTNIPGCGSFKIEKVDEKFLLSICSSVPDVICTCIRVLLYLKKCRNKPQEIEKNESFLDDDFIHKVQSAIQDLNVLKSLVTKLREDILPLEDLVQRIDSKVCDLVPNIEISDSQTIRDYISENGKNPTIEELGKRGISKLVISKNGGIKRMIQIATGN